MYRIHSLDGRQRQARKAGHLWLPGHSGAQTAQLRRSDAFGVSLCAGCRHAVLPRMKAPHEQLVAPIGPAAAAAGDVPQRLSKLLEAVRQTVVYRRRQFAWTAAWLWSVVAANRHTRTAYKMHMVEQHPPAISPLGATRSSFVDSYAA